MFQVFHPPKFCKAKIVAGKSFKKNGFTIIEISIVIFIIIVLSVMVFANYKSGQQQLALERAAYKLAQDIRRVQSLAGLEESRCMGIDGYKYGYGVFFKESPALEKKKYTLFADCNGNGRYDDPDEIIEGGEIYFEEGIEIKELSYAFLRIVFTPPDPTVAITPEAGLTAVIKIENKSGQTKTITVNRAGLINIE